MSGGLRLAASRAAQTVAVLWAVYTLTFLMVVAAPGNPFQQSAGRALDPSIERALRERYGMRDNATFYVSYLRGLMRGDLGVSLEYRNWSCNRIIADGLPVSAAIGCAAIVIAVVAGVALGIAAARRPGGAMDKLTMGLSSLAVSVPAFVSGAGLLILFSVVWPLLPVGSWGGFADVWRPALTVSLLPMAYICRLTRSGMQEALASDFVRTARASGLPERAVLLRHALPAALLPVLSYLGPAAAWALTGSFVVEKVFNIPGLGLHFVNAVLNRDQMLVLAIVLVSAALLVLFNALTDLAYAWIDPRISTEAAA